MYCDGYESGYDDGFYLGRSDFEEHEEDEDFEDYED